MKKNKLTTAVVAGLTGVAGVASVANAVNLNHEGLGQVLIYPYYSVANDLNTYLSVVNTTDMVKAVKVRFLEGDNSMEVLDFNLYLSPFDVWAAALVPTTSNFGPGQPGVYNSAIDHVGAPSGAIVYSDTSCVPYLTSGTEFRPFVIENDDPLSNGNPNRSIERSVTGHFEMLEMGELDPASTFGSWAVHGPTMNCPGLQANWNGGGAWDQPSGGDETLELLPVAGGLFGAASLVNVDEGLMVGYNAVALDNFWAPGTIQHTEPGSTLPTLASGVQDSIVLVNGAGVTSSWVDNIQAVSALFMKEQVYNEYALDAGINAKTEWIMTFPTKRFHVNGAVPIEPFTNLWDGQNACEDFGVLLWDREEGSNFCEVNPGDPICQGGGVSPIGGNTPDTPALCQEANVIDFVSDGNATTVSPITGSTNVVNVPAFVNGWARISFAQSATAGSGASFEGLPVAGFAVQQYTNAGAAEGLLAQYASLFEHKGLVTSF